MDIVEFFLDVERNDMQNMLTNPRARHTEKKDRITSAFFQAARKMWHEQDRELTAEEKNKVIQDAIKAYNREVRQRRKLKTLDKVASITL